MSGPGEREPLKTWGEGRLRLRPERILAGQSEPIFRVLPDRVLENLRHANSENALVWNLIYPRAQPTLSMQSLLEIKPLWGSTTPVAGDRLKPYFWGYSVGGDRMPGLDAAVRGIDGAGPSTEVDLFLLGERNLILVEAKNLSRLGQCSRYLHGRCPQIHPEQAEQTSCRYWEDPTASFNLELDFGDRPPAAGPAPPCSRHYQLARTLLIGRRLVDGRDLALHLWLLIPRSAWSALQRDWLDFCGRVRSQELWRRMRVIAWESIAALQG